MDLKYLSVDTFSNTEEGADSIKEHHRGQRKLK
jgi:hypothetical protein